MKNFDESTLIKKGQFCFETKNFYKNLKLPQIR